MMNYLALEDGANDRHNLIRHAAPNTSTAVVALSPRISYGGRVKLRAETLENDVVASLFLILIINTTSDTVGHAIEPERTPLHHSRSNE